MDFRLATVLAIGLAIFSLGEATATRPAQAIGICSCCLDPQPAACAQACKASERSSGQCPAFVIYDGEGAVGPTGNPLNAMSLAELSVGEPRRAQLEQFRKFLEKYRRKAIQDWKTAARAHKRGTLGKAEFDTAGTLYREALVGYYHGIRAYKDAIGSAPE